METRYHCTVCEDFDLCVACYQNDGHPHKMEKLGFDLDGGGGEAVPTSNPQEARKLSIQRCIQSLVHACQCRDANCRLPSCHKMKRVVSHTKQCKRKTNGGCPICKQLIALCCYHAKLCQVCNDFSSFGFVNDSGSAMRGNGSSWVLEPISCLPWQSAGWFDQSAARISRSNQSRLASARPTRSLARLKLGKMHLTKVNVLLTNAYFLFQMQFQPIQTCHCAVLYHIFAHITLSRRQNARFHSA